MMWESNGAKRYTLHQTIADYAMTNQINADLAIERLITFLASFVEVNQMDHEILEQVWSTLPKQESVLPRPGFMP
jgi:hypothetical protein